MRHPALLLILSTAACGSDPCGDDIQWAPFDVAEFATLCAGDSVAIRSLNTTQYMVDLNAQFKGINGAGSVSGEWSVSFDGVPSGSEVVETVPSYEADDGWTRVHTLIWLTQTTPEAVDALDASTALVTTSFTDASGANVTGEIELIATVE